MLIISAECKRNERKDVGRIMLRLKLDGHTARIDTGIVSSRAEMYTTDFPQLERALKLTYFIAKDWVRDDKPFNLEELKREFNHIWEFGISNSRYADRLNADFVYDKSIASFGRDVVKVMDLPNSEPEIDTAQLSGYISSKIKQLKEENRLNTSRNSRSLQIQINNFLQRNPFELKDVDAEFIQSFENYLNGRNLSADTVSFYMRTFSMILRKAEQENLITFGEDWFKNVEITVTHKPKEAISNALDRDTLRKIADVDLSDKIILEMWRDIFIFSFYMQGLEFVDVVNLRTENIDSEGYLVFNRRQVGSKRRIKIGEKARGIIDKYHSEDRDFIFPIAKGDNPSEYKYAQASCNRFLKQIGEQVGCPKLSFGMTTASWDAFIRMDNIAEMHI